MGTNHLVVHQQLAFIREERDGASFSCSQLWVADADLVTLSSAFWFNDWIVPLGFGLLFPGESQLRQSRATQATVQTECF